MRIKLNNLTNLADARYGAAMGADFLCFAMERGSMYKLPLDTVKDIVPWLAGSQLVLSYGADAMAALRAEEFSQQNNLWHEFNGLTIPPSEFQSLSVMRYGLQFKLGNDTWQAAVTRVLDEWIEQAGYLEIISSCTAPSLLADMLQQVRAALGNEVPLFLNVDQLTRPYLQATLGLVDGIAYGTKLKDDFTQLDYDRFERLIEECNALRRVPHA